MLGSTPAADEARFLAERLRIRLTDAPDEAPLVLVATQGQGDEDALERALKSPATHVLMIASRRKADRLRDAMRMRGVDETQLARLVAPAGPDAGTPFRLAWKDRRRWIGGGCAKDVVVGAAQAAIAKGEPKLVRISNDRIRPEEDVEQYTMACASNGTIELFLQPYSPRIALCVLGSTPAGPDAGAKTPGEIAMVAIVGVLAVLRGSGASVGRSGCRAGGPCSGSPVDDTDFADGCRSDGTLSEVRQPGVRDGGRYDGAETRRTLRRDRLLLLL